MRIEAPPEPDRRTQGFHPSLEIVVLLLLGAGILFQATGAIRLNTNLQAGDQGAYLLLSLAQAEGRALTDGNRHPLHSALLLPIAERDPRFFARARWVSCAIGMALILSLAWLEWKRRGAPLAAVLAVAFLAAHVQMLRTLSEIWCEPLLYLLVFLLWTNADSVESMEAESRQTIPNVVLGGLLAGLVYLTKGTGLQVAALFVVVVFIFSSDRKRALIPIVIFLVICSPLFLWNLTVYGNPLYSFASTHNMWFDEADEIWFENAEELPTLGSYLNTHSLGEVFARLGRGLLLETRMAGQLLWSDWRLPATEGNPVISSFWTVLKVPLVLSVLLSAGSIFLWRPGAARVASKAGWTFFGLMTAISLLTFGWYAQLTNEPRFLMMLVPIAAVLIARIVSLAWVFHSPTYPQAFRWFRGALLVYAVVVFGWSAVFAWGTRALPPPILGPLAGRALERLNALPENSKIAFGPSHGLPTWLSRGDLVWRPTPWRIDWNRFVAMLERETIGYVLIDSETVARRPYLEPLSKPGAAEALGWSLLFRDRDEGNFFMLYQVEDSPNER